MRIPFTLLPLTLAALLSACASSMPAGPSSAAGNLATTLTPIDQHLVARLRSEQQGRGHQHIEALLGKPAQYTIGGGDILTIVVWGHPELTAAALIAPTPLISPIEQAAATAAPPQGFVVSEAGDIQFPFAGSLHVDGMTEAQARDALASRLARVIQKPNVTLRVQAFRSKRIYVGGEVRAPGLQPINDIPMTLVEALNRGGGVLPTGDQSHIALLRGGTRYRIDLPGLIREGIDPASILLRNGDVLNVSSAEENKVFVAGEVVTPRALPMHNGRLTLNEALGETGGMNPISADASQVYVVRRTDEKADVYLLDAKSPGAMAVAEGFELRARDLVYVAPSGLANWHRTLSLLIPGSLPAAVSARK